MRFLAVSIVCLLVAACATVGPYDLALELAPGQTTIDQAVEILGEPISRAEYANGTTLLQWTGAWPYPGDHVSVLFDPSGTMIETQVRSRTMTRL